jgi:hypothetical protein
VASIGGPYVANPMAQADLQTLTTKYYYKEIATTDQKAMGQFVRQIANHYWQFHLGQNPGLGENDNDQDRKVLLLRIALKAVDSSVLKMTSHPHLLLSNLWHLSQNLISPTYDSELAFVNPLELEEEDERVATTDQAALLGPLLVSSPGLGQGTGVRAGGVVTGEAWIKNGLRARGFENTRRQPTLSPCEKRQVIHLSGL